MKTWHVNRGREHATHRCRQCGHPLGWVDEVGWVALGRGDAYDMCDADPYGNHEPRPIEPELIGSARPR